MNPANPTQQYPAETIPFHGMRYNGTPGQPKSSTQNVWRPATDPAYPTQNYSAETVPLQRTRYEDPLGQPQRSTVVQHTTVDINSEPPQDHIIWSICNLVYGNLCFLGLAALVFSVKARDRKMVGDLNGAKHYGTTARCLNIWATVLVSLIFFIIFILVIASIA
ncbi:interferon-induced transmembrane protein 1-like [Melanotaenia boesemani]|uniref:interferon-induced transmembrane protein 1-like n=1 Tax=Melanotaenia boesemani TaxID=1250792 RepID=UPI001C05022E|nr:interferon-induced transmembrane protein 1-like [Melanotaenia boesemani]